MAKKGHKAPKKKALKKEIRAAQLSEAKGGTAVPYQNVKQGKRP